MELKKCSTDRLAEQKRRLSHTAGPTVVFILLTSLLWCGCGQAQDTLHLVVSLGIFIGLDKVLKEGFAAAGIRFPSALFGMFCLFAVLNILEHIRGSAAASVVSFFQPANTFIQRWLPIFYVPSLVVIPLSVKGIPVADGAKIAVILGEFV